MSGQLHAPAPRPCTSCPYRRDVPSGVWAPSEYRKLPRYDRPTAEQPMGVFQCHQTEQAAPGSRVCAGWAAVHTRNPRGHELISLRLAAWFERLDAATVEAVWAYTTPVPLFASGALAAAHGMGEVDYPGLAAQLAMNKITRRRRFEK